MFFNEEFISLWSIGVHHAISFCLLNAHKRYPDSWISTTDHNSLVNIGICFKKDQ